MDAESADIFYDYIMNLHRRTDTNGPTFSHKIRSLGTGPEVMTGRRL